MTATTARKVRALTKEQRERHNQRRREQYAKSRTDPTHTVLPPLGRWIGQAACAHKGMAPELFWSPADREPRPRTEVLLAEQRQIAHVCGGCPVRRECLDEARAHGFTGTWGGVLRLEKGLEHDLIATHLRPERQPAA